MRTYSWAVEAEPYPAQRPRVTRHGTYTPKPTIDAERLVAWSFRQAYPGHIKADPHHEWDLHVNFYRGTRYRYDLDNLAKTIMDGLNGVLWTDDFQVTTLHLFTFTVPRGQGRSIIVATKKVVGYWSKVKPEEPDDHPES